MRAALVCTGLLCAALHASAADGWLRLASPHFELFTDAGEKKGRDAIAHFEQARSFFDKASPVTRPTDFPVRLILFRGENSYRAYRISAAGSAYFTSSHSRDYIVMGDSDSEVYKVALHEYMHLMLRHSGLKLPVWLNEGWADVYSTLRPVADGAAVGDMLQGRVQVLFREPWLSFDELTAVNQSSAVYNETTRAGMFYSESWALVHMLYLAPDYKDGFPKFVNALQQGHTAAEACQIAWSKTSAEVFRDLRGYLKRKALYGAVFEVRLDRLAANPHTTPVSPTDAGLVLADLLAATHRFEEAQQMLQRIATEHSGRPDVLEALGYVAWARGDTQTARQDFEISAQQGANDPRMFFHLAMLERGAQQPLARSQALLERAVALKPDYMEARLELGLVLLAEGQHAKALTNLFTIASVDAEHASRLFNALAYAYAQGGDVEKARQNVEKARNWAKTDADRKQSDEILRWIAAQK